ncbi:MAG: carbon-nitrogen hydrolase family protein [Elusimicrobia bacterium]|nr:carbon-nitrogen hydrolase family protein [Elusimicrobiota bacterium]
MSARLKLSVSPVALELSWNDPDANLAKIDAALATGLKGVSRPEEHLFLFPELTLTGFATKEPPAIGLSSGPVSKLSALAKKHKTAVAAGFPEKAAGKPLNALALFGPDGKLVARYHKLHLFTWGKNPEAATYEAGKTGVVADYRGWKLGFAICFDIRFPPLFHEYAKAGVDLLLISSCWIGGPHKTYQYRTITSGHAILTQAYVAAVNRAGKDPFFEYDGSQYVFSPFGEETSGALDPAELENARKLVVRPSDLKSYRVV